MTARLIDLQSFRGFQPIVVRAETVEESPHRLTMRDRMAMAAWSEGSDRHGYRRVLIVSGDRDGEPDEADYALVYAGDESWARWGLTRGGVGITLWHCSSGEDIGAFDTVDEALDSLPPAIAPAIFHGKLLHRR